MQQTVTDYETGCGNLEISSIVKHKRSQFTRYPVK